MPDTPGWTAITEAMAARYEGPEAQHWAPMIPQSLGGPDPLDGVSAYDAGDHWHYVTYGLTELEEKVSELPDQSGWGFELTFRLAKYATEPPVWPVNLLQTLARYVFQTGNVLFPGDKMPFNSPIDGESDTPIRAAFFLEDPQLGSIDTPHGRVVFVQMVGVTEAELAQADRWSTEQVAALLGDDLWITDLGRACRTEDPTFLAAVDAGAEQEGSSAEFGFVDSLSCTVEDEVAHVVISPLAVQTVGRLIATRLGEDLPYILEGPGRTLTFLPDGSGVVDLGDAVQIGLTEEEAAAFADVSADAGSTRIGPVVLAVTPAPN